MKRDATGTILVLKPNTEREKEHHHQMYGEHVEEWNVIL